MRFKKWTASVTLLTFLFTNLLTFTPNLTRTQQQAEAATAQDGLEYAYIGLNIGVTLKNLGGNKYQLNTPNGNTYTATYNNSGVLWFNGIEATSEFSPISGRSPIAIDNFLATYYGSSSKIPVSGDTGGDVSGRIYGVNEPNPTKGQQMVKQSDNHASLQSLSVGEGSNYVVYCNAGFKESQFEQIKPNQSESLSIAVVMAFRNVKYNGGWSPYDGGGGGGGGGGDVDPPPKPPVGHRVSYTETASPKILRGNYKDVINGKTFDIKIKGKLTFRCDNGGDSWLDVTYNGGDYVDYKSTENPTYQYTYHLKADEDWLEPGYNLSLKDKWNVSCYHACSEDVGKGTIYHTIQTVFTNQEPTASGKVYMKTGGQTNNLWRERDIVFEDTSTDPENDLMDRKYVIQYEKDGTYINVANIVETRTSSTGAWTFNVTGVDNTYIKKVTPNQKGFIFQVMKKGNYQIKQDVGDVNNLPAVTQLWDNNDDNLCRFIVDKDPAPPVADFDYMIGTKVVTSAFVGANVTLKNKSTDPDDDISVYSWVPKYVTPTNGAFTKGPLNTRDTWIVPGVIGSMSTKLTVTDDSGFSDNKTKTLKITPPIPIPDVQVPDPNVDPDNPGGGGGNPDNPDGGGGDGDNPDISVKPNETLNKYYMKENRLIVFDISNSANPPTQPIKWERTTWKVEKDGVTMGTDKVPYIEAADHKSRKYLFREKGTYKVTVTLHNDYTDNTPGIDMSNAIMSFNVKIKEDTVPNAKIAVTGNSANFRDNPNKTDVTLADATVSKDADFIKDDIVLKPADTPDVAFGRGVKAYDWKVILDANDDGIFDLGRGDKLIYDTRDGASNFNFSVPFTPNTKGNYRIFFTARETFGQKTIPQFVSDADRRVTSITQNFNVNWVPDISYKIANAPIWQYDTQAFTTTIKDERPNTTNVEWAVRELKVGPDYNYVHESGRDSMSKAEWDSLPWLPTGEKDLTGTGHLIGDWWRSPLDTEFAVEWSDVIDESSLTRDGGTIKFKRAGKYRLYAKITDEVGQTYTYYDDVRVLPVPVADLNDQPALRWESVPWQAKQNRLFGTVGGGTVHDPYLDFNWGDFPPTYTPPTAGAGTEIDYSKSKLIISPLDGQNLNTLFVVNQGGQTAIPSERTDCYQVSNVPNEMQMMSKSVGRYNITLQMQNKAGKPSLPTSRTMTVKADLPPVIDCHVDEVVNRDPANGNIVTVDIYNIDTTSKDADVVNDIQLQYRYDSNNNGSFEDEAWQNADPIVFDATTQKGSSKFRGNKVGKYQVRLYGREQFGQATLNKYIVAADHLDGEVLRYVTCDNVAPVADLSAQKGHKVDIVVAVGNLEESKTTNLNAKINTYIKNLLSSYGASTIDSVIQTVETSKFDAANSTPEQILNAWGSVPNPGGFYVYGDRIINNNYISWPGIPAHEANFNAVYYYDEKDVPIDNVAVGADYSVHGCSWASGFVLDYNPKTGYGVFGLVFQNEASIRVGKLIGNKGEEHMYGPPQEQLTDVRASQSISIPTLASNREATTPVKFTKAGNKYTLYVNGTETCSAVIDGILPGYAGIHAGCDAAWKGVYVEQNSGKSLYDVLMGDVTWRPGAIKVVLDIEGKYVYGLGENTGVTPAQDQGLFRVGGMGMPGLYNSRMCADATNTPGSAPIYTLTGNALVGLAFPGNTRVYGPYIPSNKGDLYQVDWFGQGLSARGENIYENYGLTNNIATSMPVINTDQHKSIIYTLKHGSDIQEMTIENSSRYDYSVVEATCVRNLSNPDNRSFVYQEGREVWNDSHTTGWCQIDLPKSIKTSDIRDFYLGFTTSSPANSYEGSNFVRVSEDGINYVEVRATFSRVKCGSDTVMSPPIINVNDLKSKISNIRYIQIHNNNRVLGLTAIIDCAQSRFTDSDDTERDDSGRIAALLEEQDINLVAIGNSNNSGQFNRIINSIGSEQGTFIQMTDPLDSSLQKSGRWILDLLTKSNNGDVQYLLLNDFITYSKRYSDFENDPQYTSHSKWYYDHEPNYFDNSLGYHDKTKQWLDNSINEFDRTGKYLVTWQTKDNPVGNDERFAEYRKLSSMMNGPLILYVHRKPIADFTPHITKSGATFNVSFTESSYDLDHTSRGDKGIRTKKWSWKEVDETSWHIGPRTSFQTTKDFLIKLEVQDIDGPSQVGVWSDPQVMLLSTKAQPPVAKFNWSPQILPLGQDISLKDTSYDPNGDPIVEERWVLYFNNAKVGDRTLTNNSGVTAGQVEEVRTWVQQQIEAKGHSGYGGWKLTLQVRDNTGVWGDTKSTSDVYTQNFTVTPNNRPPDINIDTGNGGSITNGGNDNWDPSKPGNNIGNAQPIGYKRNVYVDAVTNDGAVVNSPLLSHRNYLNVLFNPRITVTDPDAGGRFPNHQGFEYSWEFKNHDSLTKVIKSTSEMKDSDIITTKTFGPKQSTSGSEIPFNNGFSNNGLKPGPYEMIVSVKDRPIYGNPQTVSGSIKFYVVPNLTGSINVTPYGDEIMVGEKVKVRVTTDKWTNGVDLRMEKNFDVNNPYSNTPAKPGLTWINVPFKENANGTYIYECDYVIPELTDSGDYFFTARLNTTAGSKDVYGVDNRVTRYKFITERHAVTALKVIDFVISDMKYHPQYDGLFPIKRPDMPVDYTAGYYVHFKVTTKGEPDKVIGNMKIEGVDAGQIEFVQTGVNGNEQIWEGKWFAPADTDIGSKITIEIEASRGATEYNYNDKEGWDGHTLTVVGSALEDAVINRTH